ncbi:MAG: pilus (MSHA type) biogenesis protein MshL [Desulfotalea sp.]
MKYIKHMFRYTCLLLVIVSLSACSANNKNDQLSEQKNSKQNIEESKLISSSPVIKKKTGPKQLPVQYQTPAYEVNQQKFDEAFSEEKTSIKVGATIRSNNGPMPLGEILKSLTALKGMNISWASDVNRDVLVDVDIKANDDFYDAIESMLRQVDYFHEVEKSTIVVKYKETRQFHVAMPFIKSNYTTSTGGNMLGNNDGADTIDGTMALESKDNPFDIWENIQANMDAILDTWDTNLDEKVSKQTQVNDDEPLEENVETPTAARRVAKGGTMYIIDKPIGLITVSAPRPLLDRLDDYFSSLKKEIYKQVSIDAKIIEVSLTDGSSIGIDWSGALKGFEVGGNVTYGNGGNVFNNAIPDSSAFHVGTVNLGTSNFKLLINALKEQGDTKVLSNPKLSVMNGQPALITVGKNITYISSIESDVDTDTNIVTYTTNVDSLLSGLGLGITATIMEDNSIIMNLVPVTSELTTTEVQYKKVGLGEVGLPVVNVREMSTTVKVRDGDTLIIGGLISENTKNEGNSVPILGSIPLLGRLFSSETKATTKTELVILIKPRII